MTRIPSTHLPMCIMNMCYEPVHDLVRVCTSNHAYTISSLYAHITPIMHNSSRSKHNVYMLALYSRDAYDYTARLDRMTNHRLDHLHMTYHSRDKTP